MTTSAVKVVEEHPNFMGQRCRQGGPEVGRHHGFHQDGEVWSRLRGLHDGLVSWQQHLVDQMDHPVAGLHIGGGDLGDAVSAIGDHHVCAGSVHFEEASLHGGHALAQ